MSTIWIVSEDRAWLDSLAYHLRALGEVWTGPPERGHWRGAETPDLIALLGVDAASGDLSGLERLLDFIRGVPHLGRSPQPLIYAEPPGSHPSGETARRLIDDRKIALASWPLEPDDLVDLGARLLQTNELPISLRERERRDWVGERVEILYADLDLPALRQAVNPRNAARPVLLLGEPGTRRGLLARYVHNLAEPARDRLIVLPAADLSAHELERRVLGESVGERVTLFLSGLERADHARQEEIAEFLGASGALGIEQIRWLASAARTAGLAPGLRGLPWIRVELPSLRNRADREPLIRSLARAWSKRSGREVEFDAEALTVLTRYAWPGNLRELESVIDASCSAASGSNVRAEDVQLGPRGVAPVARVTPEEDSPEADFATGSLDELTESTFSDLDEAEFGPLANEIELEPGDEDLELDVVEPLRAVHLEAVEEEPEAATDPASDPGPGTSELPRLTEVMPALAQEIRLPLRAIRTCANLVDQQPDDASRRQELATLFENDLGRLEEILTRLETYSKFGRAEEQSFDLAASVASELDAHHETVRSKALVVLRELDHDAPQTRGDETQVRFAIGSLLSRALRMVPARGDLYVGSKFLPAANDRAGRHRLLIRFHSPEEVLVGPDDGPEPRIPIEVMLARELIERSGGRFAVDASGAQDNLILVELGG
ncbi:MAG: hypothetical protein GY725_02270 [bacterium]|nr:hypothetical protein [bacterium]